MATQMTSEERAALRDSLGTVRNDLDSFGDWVRNATGTLNDYEVEYEDDDYEGTTYVDLGQFGEQETTVRVSVSGSTYESIEVDVAQLVDDESPLRSYWFRDDALPVLDQVIDLLDSADLDDGSTSNPFAGIGEPETSREAATASAVARLVADLLGPDPDGIRRTLRAAFESTSMTVEPVNPSPGFVAAVDYDPLTVPTEREAADCRVRDLRLGDDVTGAAFGRLVRVERDSDYSERVRITLNRDGIENTSSYRLDSSFEVRPVAPESVTSYRREVYAAAVDSLDLR